MKEIEIKHHVELINDSEEKELFEKHKDYVLEIANHFLSSFDFSANLKIYVADIGSEKEFVNGEIADASSSITKYGHVIILSSMLLRLTEKDGGLRLGVSLLHELAHVYDHHHILHSPYCKFNPMKLSQKNVDDLVFACGYHFWTEFFAYYKTFNYFHEERENYPTFLKLVKAYRNLKEKHVEVSKYYLSNRKQTSRKFLLFKSDIDDFVYALAKYMAGAVNKQKNIEYCEKTKNMKEFEEVDRIIQRLYVKVTPIFTNVYGRGMVNKIGWLGNRIIVNIYEKFNVYPVQGRKRAQFSLCFRR